MKKYRMIVIIAFLTISLHSLAVVAAEAPAKVTYDDHVRPIMRQHCMKCHDSDKKKGGLALDSYSSAMEGGSSGEVIERGDLDSSRLWGLMSHDESPEMPPNQDRIGDDQLALVRRWIEGGALENSGSKAVAKPRAAIAMSHAAPSRKPDGPAAMPQGVSRQPVAPTARPGAVTALAASPWAPLVAVAGQRQVSLVDTTSNRSVGILPFPEGVPHVLRFSRNGELLLVAGGHAARLGVAALFDVRTGRRLTTVGDALDVVLAADVKDDHSQIAIGGPGGKVQVFATRDGSVEYTIKKHTEWIRAIEYSPDGVLLATADRAGSVSIWEADTGREFLGLAGHKASVTSVSWRLDSNLLATAGEDGTVQLWEMNDGRKIKGWTAHPGGVLSVAFTHDGRLLTAGRDKKTKLWNQQGKSLAELPPMTDIALAAVVTYDGKHVVAGDWGGEVRVWSIADRKEVGRLLANPPTLKTREAEAIVRAKRSAAALAEARRALATVEQKIGATKAAWAETHRQRNDTVEVAVQAARQATAAADAAARLAEKSAAARELSEKEFADAEGNEKPAAKKRLETMIVAAEAAKQQALAAKQAVDRLAVAKAAGEQLVAAWRTAETAALAEHEQRLVGLRKKAAEAQRADDQSRAAVENASRELAAFRARRSNLHEASERAKKKLADATAKALAEATAHRKAIDVSATQTQELQALARRLAALKNEVTARQAELAASKRRKADSEQAVARAEDAAREAAADQKAWEAAYGKQTATGK